MQGMNITRHAPTGYAGLKMEIVESAYTTLRTIGKDERWLLMWIKEKPSRLGLGELTIEHPSSATTRTYLERIFVFHLP
jgi:hypothetical protein